MNSLPGDVTGFDTEYNTSRLHSLIRKEAVRVGLVHPSRLRVVAYLAQVFHWVSRMRVDCGARALIGRVTRRRLGDECEVVDFTSKARRIMGRILSGHICSRPSAGYTRRIFTNRQFWC